MPAFQLSEELRHVLEDPQTVKVLAAAGKSGGLHAVFLDTLDVVDARSLLVPARLENGVLNQSLLYSLWFDHTASLSLHAWDGRLFDITVRPRRCLVTGKLFEQYYDRVRENDPQSDLASVWLLEFEQAREETYAVRREEERRAHPLFTHLDQIAKG